MACLKNFLFISIPSCTTKIRQLSNKAIDFSHVRITCVHSMYLGMALFKKLIYESSCKINFADMTNQLPMFPAKNPSLMRGTRGGCDGHLYC